MSSVNLSSYSREQLTDILRILKLYKTSYAQIGRRARMIDPRIPALPVIRVEYPTDASLDEIRPFAEKSLAQFFDIKKPTEPIAFEPKQNIVGGVRIFVDDDMIDVSFQRFANFMKQGF